MIIAIESMSYKPAATLLAHSLLQNLPHGYFEDVQVVYAVESEGKSPGSYANNQDDEHGMTRTDLPLHKYFVQHMMSDDPSVRRVVGAA